MSSNKRTTLALIMMLILALTTGCGSGSTGNPIKNPPASPPEATEETPEIQIPLDTVDIEVDGNIETLSTNPLYNAEDILVFFTSKLVSKPKPSFAAMLQACVDKGAEYGYEFEDIGILNGYLKEEGYTRDFLLNPDVERSYISNLGRDVSELSIVALFVAPLNIHIRQCTDDDGNSIPCNRFACGSINRSK